MTPMDTAGAARAGDAGLDDLDELDRRNAQRIAPYSAVSEIHGRA
jgi:hypothetical protein